MDKKDIKLLFAKPYIEYTIEDKKTRENKVVLRMKSKPKDKTVLVDMNVSNEMLVKQLEAKLKKEKPEWIIVRIP